jgi:hypothetical protein
MRVEWARMVTGPQGESTVARTRPHPLNRWFSDLFPLLDPKGHGGGAEPLLLGRVREEAHERGWL